MLHKYTSCINSEDVIPWGRHQMETFSALPAICVGNSPVTGEFLAQRPVTWSFDVSLTCARINDLVNNREAGDLRRHRANYDVTVMTSYIMFHNADPSLTSVLDWTTYGECVIHNTHLLKWTLLIFHTSAYIASATQRAYLGITYACQCTIYDYVNE